MGPHNHPESPTSVPLTATSKIKLLPEHLINQIKAGEVVERPAGLLKEILENSLDAQASKIDLQIVNGGLDLIALSDDGIGMAFEELPWAFQRHTTSKIETFEDLYHLYSYGFRGEALASICAISRLTCTSSPRQENTPGGKIIFHGGEMEAHYPIPQSSPSAPQDYGTSLFIKDLFFNTPARLKFIKSKLTEKNHLKKVVNAFLLSHPHVRFTVKWDQQEKEIFPVVGEERWWDRVLKMFYPGQKESAVLPQMLFPKNEFQGYQLKGVVDIHEGPAKKVKYQYLFVNQRSIQDRALHQIVLNTLNPSGNPAFSENCSYCLFFTLPPENIDVNIHPNKTTIKFETPSLVYSLLSSSLKAAVHRVAKGPTPGSLGPLPGPSQQAALPPAPAFSLPGTGDGLTLFPVSSQYLLLHWPGQTASSTETDFYFLKGKLCLGHYFLSSAKKTPVLTEDQVIPLFITHPFSCPLNPASPPVDAYFPELKSLGLEFDRLNEKTVTLRSIPPYLDSLDYPPLIQELLGFLGKISVQNQEASEVSLEKVLPHFFLDQWPKFGEFSFNLPWATKAVKTLGIPYLIREKIILPLNERNLDRFFG